MAGISEQIERFECLFARKVPLECGVEDRRAGVVESSDIGPAYQEQAQYFVVVLAGRNV